MSDGLSTRLTKYSQSHTLVDDSAPSENTLVCAINKVFMQDECGRDGIEDIWIRPKITLAECMRLDTEMNIPPKYAQCMRLDTVMNIPPKYAQCYMKPDGGIVWIKHKGNDIPILIAEDKVQGTNDTRHEQQLHKQSTGNAIERAAKNIRMAEMIFSKLDFFPYVIFASGCDFHDTESISARLSAMNYGKQNYYIPVTPETTDQDIIQNITQNILPQISISKTPTLDGRRCYASIFIKAHKWNEMTHGSSNWKTTERMIILEKIYDLIAKRLSRDV